MATIDSRTERVQFLLGNRTDINTRIHEWYADAYIELGMSVPFVELEDTLDGVFVAGFGTLDYPPSARAAKAFTGFVNNSPYPLLKRDIRVVERIPENYTGVPSIWAPYGAGVIVRPVPNQSYNYRMRFWLKPEVDQTDDDTISETELLVPDDWLEILDHAAAMRGNIALGQAEKAVEIRSLLYGDPKNQRDNPGWIKAKQLRDAAENVVSDYATNPNIRSYSSQGC